MFKRKSNETMDYEFLPDVLEVTEKPVSKSGTFIIYTIFIIILLIIFGSFVAKVDVVVSSRGQMKPSGDLRVLQPFESGILVKLNVEDGSYVKQGEVVAELDTFIKDVNVDLNNELLNRNKAEQKILNKLINNSEFVLSYDFVNEKYNYLVDTYNSKENVYKSKINIYNSLIESNNSNIDLLNHQNERIENSLLQNESDKKTVENMMENESTNEIELNGLNTKLSYYNDLVTKNLELKNNGIISEFDYNTIIETKKDIEKQIDVKKEIIRQENLQYQNQLTTLELNKSSLLIELETQKSKLNTIKLDNKKILADIENLRATRLEVYNNKLVEIESSILGYTSELDKFNKEITYYKLESPISGYVHNIKINTLGEVIKAGDTLLEIVPDNEKLVTEIYVKNKDIGMIKEGMEVIIKIDTYPFQEFGTIIGVINKISANSYMMENVGYVYMIEILPYESTILKNGIEYKLSSGMQVTGEIVIGERRVIQYFLDPVVKALDESIKQN